MVNKVQKRRNLVKNFGAALVSVGELVFGGIAIGGIMAHSRTELITLGLIIGGVLIIAGVFLETDDKE